MKLTKQKKEQEITLNKKQKIENEEKNCRKKKRFTKNF